MWSPSSSEARWGASGVGGGASRAIEGGRPVDEALSDDHLGGQGGAHGTLLFLE
jgi:hypothetical protein